MKKILIYQMLPRLWGSLHSTSSANSHQCHTINKNTRNNSVDTTIDTSVDATIDNTNIVNKKNGTLEENGCGKFSNIDNETLNYLKWMGISHLWLTGILAHASKSFYPGAQQVSHPQFVKGEAGSPYAITNYYDTNPYLADNPEDRMVELEETFKRIHKAGLKVIIDFVPNHVSRNYKDNTEFSFGINDNKDLHWDLNNDFYYYPGEELKLENEEDFNAECLRFKSGKLSGEFQYIPAWLVNKAKDIFNKSKSLTTDKGKLEFEKLIEENNKILTSYKEYPARATGNNFSASPSINDWYDTVKLNYCDFYTPTWEKMLKIIDFWAEKGVDGFRCDMVELVPRSFMKWLIAESKKKHKDLIFIAEVYQKELYNEYANNVGFDLLYDKSGVYDALKAIVDGNLRGDNSNNLWESTKVITRCWQSSGLVEDKLLNFLENHDEQRFASDFFGKKAENVYPSLYTSLFMGKASFMLYFGEEFGERGMDEEGQSGRDGRTTIYDWWSPTQITKLYEIIHTKEFNELLEDYPFKSTFIKENFSREQMEAFHNDVIKKLKKYVQDDSELEVFFNYIIALRLAVSHSSVQNGKFYDLCYCNFGAEGFDENKHYAFLRGESEEVILIFCNFSSNSSNVRLTIPQDAIEYLNLKPQKIGLEHIQLTKTGSYEIEIQIDGFDAKWITL